MKHFEFKKQTAKFVFQSRVEKAGKENRPAATGHFTVVGSNTLLDRVDAKYRGLLFRKRFKDEEEANLADAGLAPSDGLNKLNLPNVGYPLKLADLFPNMELNLYYGIGDDPKVELGDCTVDALKLTPIDGGCVEIEFNVACHPDEDEAGQMHVMSGNEVTFDLVRSKDPAKNQKELVTA